LLRRCGRWSTRSKRISGRPVTRALPRIRYGRHRSFWHGWRSLRLCRCASDPRRQRLTADRPSPRDGIGGDGQPAR
jgi:hypothetical protein